jgi:hypothetical protein
MTGYGPLTISVEVQDQGHSLGESGGLRTVVLDPPVATKFGIAAGATTAGVLILAFIGWRRRRVTRPG